MAKAKRRQTQAGKSRRTPATPTGGSSRFKIPTVPILVFLGLVVIGGLIAYLVWQGGKPASDSNARWVEVEADAAPDLPGEFVDIQTIYGETYGQNAPHVSREVDYAADGNSNPPAGGPHWGNAGCGNDPETAPPFCGPAPWGIFSDPWEPATLVHNMEHGGVVVWYNLTDPADIEALEDVVLGLLNDDALIVMTPYSGMEDETIAITTWARLDKFPVADFTEERVKDYINTHERRFNPEGF